MLTKLFFISYKRAIKYPFHFQQINIQISQAVLIFQSFLYFIYCIPTFLWQKLIKENHRAIKISTQRKENKICQNRTVCSNLTISNNYVTPKVLKNQDGLRNLYINLLQKELSFQHALVKNENCFCQRKSFCFLARSNNYHPRRS